jgi:hypothetical protein
MAKETGQHDNACAEDRVTHPLQSKNLCRRQSRFVRRHVPANGQILSYPIVSPYRELRSSLAELRLNDLAVGEDARNRTILSAFRSRTGRNQPSNTRFIFGPSVWLRGLIKPPPGCAIAYIDWAQQEVGIAAALSRDPALLAAYQSGDVYAAFARQAGARARSRLPSGGPFHRDPFASFSK